MIVIPAENLRRHRAGGRIRMNRCGILAVFARIGICPCQTRSWVEFGNSEHRRAARTFALPARLARPRLEHRSAAQTLKLKQSSRRLPGRGGNRDVEGLAAMCTRKRLTQMLPFRAQTRVAMRTLHLQEFIRRIRLAHTRHSTGKNRARCPSWASTPSHAFH